MPILHHVRQGSDAWDKLRLGIPTSSVFDRVWTPPSAKYPRGQQSKQWEDLAFTLLAERFLGYKMATYVSPHMEDGKEYEEEAADWYELTTHRVPVLIGFITNDAGTIGCSPDRLVGDDGLLEVKVPKANTQMKYLIKGTIAVDYWPQLQGQLWISDRQWVDIVAYSQILPRCVIRVERDEPYIAKLAVELDKLVEYIEVCWEKIQEMAGRSNGVPKDPRQGDLGRLKAQLEASLAREDKARSASTAGAQTEVVGDRPMPGVLPHQGPGESSAPLLSEPADATPQPGVGGGGSSGRKGEPPTKVCRCECGEEFEIYGAFSRHRQRTGHKAEAKAVVGSIEREARAGPCAAGASGDAAPSPLSPRHPEFRHGKIGLRGTITREDARAYPDRLFVFGDNMARKGFGGQAKELRGEPNAVGIPTKWRPDMNEGAFFTNADWQRPEVQNAISEAFQRLEKHLEAGADVVYPAAGIGTGHAQLAQRAPKIAAHIETRLAALAQVASIAEHKADNKEQRPEALRAGRSSSGQDAGIATELQPANPETRVRVPPDSTTEETFWDIAARSGDYKVEIPDKNIATIGRDQMMNLVADAPTVEALTAFYQGNLATIETMGKARVASRNELVKAMTRRKKELSGE